MSTPSKAADPADFPALRAFLRAYLHEDFIVDYGSAAKALEAFLDDASAYDVRSLDDEAGRFLAATEGLSVRKLRVLLAEGFGCSWEPSSREEIVGVLGQIGSLYKQNF